MRLDVALETCNAAPVARIRGPASSEKGGTLVLDSSDSSDSNGDGLTMRWSLDRKPDGSGLELADPTAPQQSLTLDATGVFEVSLVVSDGELDSAPATHAITVQNRPPVAFAGDDRIVEEGVPVTLDASGSSDPDDDPLTYAWTLVTRPAGSQATLTDATSVRTTLVPDVRGVYEASLVVSDGERTSDPDMVRIGIGVSASVPIASAGDNRSVLVGERVGLSAIGSFDPDGDPLTYQWSLATRPAASVAQLETSSTATTAFTPDEPGIYVVSLVVDDGFWQSEPDTVEIAVDVDPVGPSEFDTAEVYLIGTLIEGLASRGCIIDPRNGTTISTGFGSTVPARLRVRPTDGAIVYLNPSDFSLRTFEADPFVYDMETQSYIYPSNPLENDSVLDTVCPGDLEDFVVDPISGEIFYKCGNSSAWYEQSSGTARAQLCSFDNNQTRDLYGIGLDGSVLCQEAIIDPSGVEHPTGIRHTSVDSGFRARPDGGFWYVVASGNHYERWAISTDGSLTRELTYADRPDGMEAQTPGPLGRLKLDGQGNLHEIVNLGVDQDYIIRYSGPDTADVIYNEGAQRCKMHGDFYLFSG